MTKPEFTEVTADRQKREDKKEPLNEILRNIIGRVKKEKNHRTPTGYSRMHHRHSRT